MHALRLPSAQAAHTADLGKRQQGGQCVAVWGSVKEGRGGGRGERQGIQRQFRERALTSPLPIQALFPMHPRLQTPKPSFLPQFLLHYLSSRHPHSFAKPSSSFPLTAFQPHPSHIAVTSILTVRCIVVLPLPKLRQRQRQRQRHHASPHLYESGCPVATIE